MKYKIVVIDVFNTLLNSDGVLSDENRNSLLQAQQENGTRVLLTTGRGHRVLEPLAEVLQLEKYSGYLIPYHGARIVNCRSGKGVMSHFLGEDLLDRILLFAETEVATLLSFGEGYLFSSRDCELAKAEAELNRQELLFTKPNEPIIKCAFLGDADRIAELEVLLRRKFDGELNIFRSSETLLELLPASVNKVEAINELLDKLDLDREELICVGDSYCDVEMIQMAGMGVAVANAREAVKACADYITLSNDDNGVAHLIEKYIRRDLEDVPFTVDDVNSIIPGTLMDSLGIRCTAVARGYVEATMPVDIRTRQPMGILHGGANLALAETLAGFGSVGLLNPGEIQVGMQVSGNHVASALEGDVMRAEATIMHQGRSTHVWSVNIYSTRSGKLICTCRVLNSIIKQR